MGGPHPQGAILGAEGAHRKVWGLSAVSCAKTTEPIDLPFRLWTRVAAMCTRSIVFASWRQYALTAWRIGATRRIRNAGDAATRQITLTACLVLTK